METSYLETDICKSDHGKLMKADPCWLLPQKLAANLNL